MSDLTRNGRATWDELRRAADEIEIQIHLAGMEARDRWRVIQPRFEKLEHQLSTARLEFIEWIVVILIAFEIVMPLLSRAFKVFKGG